MMGGEARPKTTSWNFSFGVEAPSRLVVNNVTPDPSLKMPAKNPLVVWIA